MDLLGFPTVGLLLAVRGTDFFFDLRLMMTTITITAAATIAAKMTPNMVPNTAPTMTPVRR